MASDISMLASFDAWISDVLAGWDTYSTLILSAIVAFAIYSFVFAKEPDIHPFLLARQATASPVRQEGESAAYRSLETPHGFPLRSGLNVKDPGSPKWTSGRRGDLRDVWKAAARGAINPDGSVSGKQGKIYTVLGKTAIEHSLDQVTQEINVIGKHLQSAQVKTVAICLTDSVELLAAIFAGAFYGFKTAIIPFNLPPDAVSAYLQKAQAEALIAEAGALDLSMVAKGNKQLSRVLWVAKLGSQHMDWNDAPEDVQDSLSVAVWHELVGEKKDLAGFEVPSWDPSSPAPPVATVWSSSSEVGEFIDYQPENLSAGISALGAAMPRNQRINSNDLVLSIDSLAQSYPLCQIMAALYTNASIAVNSVAGESIDFALATAGVSPTVIVASSHTMYHYHHQIMRPQAGIVSSITRWFQARDLDAGVMPSRGIFSQIANIGPTAELSLNRLRLLCISHRFDTSSEVRLSLEQLTDLRIFTGARVVYALTGPGVAGAITQTNVFDYRRFSKASRASHFGPPLSSVEVILTGSPEGAGGDKVVEGQITANGPAVVGGRTTLSARGRFRYDNTLELCP